MYIVPSLTEDMIIGDHEADLPLASHKQLATIRTPIVARRVHLVQVNEVLGLHTRPSKPLLWKLGGHPRLPPSQHLYSLACQLQQLCTVVSAASADDPAALSPVKQLLLSARTGTADDQRADAALSEGSADREQISAEGISDETALTVAANLAADMELRQALQEGTALFQLVVSQAALQPGSLPALGRLGSKAADPAAAAASIVDSLQREVLDRALKVISLLLASTVDHGTRLEKLLCTLHSTLPSCGCSWQFVSLRLCRCSKPLLRQMASRSLLQLGRGSMFVCKHSQPPKCL